MDGVVEIITGRERRRRWSVQDKLRVVADTQEPGARVCDVAARHSVCQSLVFTWRRQARDGVLVEPEMPAFMPVQMLEAPGPVTTISPHREQHSAPAAEPIRSQVGLIEIELGNGRQVRVGSDVNLAALRRVLAALKA
jgi:transposase